MLKVGLTGSIAVGKSFVTSVFAELGAHVLDADQTAREVVAVGTPGLAEIVKNFGAEVLLPDGSLNRARLGEIIFADNTLRTQLNKIVHPLVFAAQDEKLREWEAQDPAGVGLVDAALLIESGGFRRFDKIIVVHCQPDIQLSRLMRRNNLSQVEAEQRIKVQMPQEEKKRYADYLVDTSDGFTRTREEVVKLYGKLKELARDPRRGVD